nr:DUF2306 domain-containing protein [Paenibacillus oenotherae]
MTILAFAIAGYGIVQYLVLGADSAGFVQEKLLKIKLNSLWYTMIAIHVMASVTSLMLGPFTLSSKFRAKHLNRHRIMGRIYLTGILFGCGTGVYLAFYATGGIVSTFGFGSLSILWFYTAYQALRNILGKRVESHRRWMIRNYALTLAAVTLRLWLLIFVLVFGEERFEWSYTIISWLSWVPNLLLAECFIKKWAEAGSMSISS